MKSIAKYSVLAGLTLLATTIAAKAEEPYCREYTQSFSVGGHTENGYGTACLQPDGSWEIVSQDNEAAQKKADVQYLVREEKVYVMPTRVYPRHYWGYPTTYIGVNVRSPNHYRGYNNYGHHGRNHGWH